MIPHWESPSEKLRSFSRPVTHLYARATSCLIDASTQLANWANSQKLKLKWLNISYNKINKVIGKMFTDRVAFADVLEFFFPLFN